MSRGFVNELGGEETAPESVNTFKASNFGDL